MKPAPPLRRTRRSVPQVMAALAVGLAAVVALTGCGLLNPTAQPSAPATSAPPTPASTPSPSTTPLGPLTGTWEGTWMNTTPIQAVGTFTLTWAQQGSRLVGALSVSGSDCLRSGNVTGTVFGVRLRFGAVEGPVTIEYDGSVVDADTIQGTYRSDCGPSEGTWAATLADT